MPYCVNCGVELDKTAGFCALCQTAVYHPDHLPDTSAQPPFPPEAQTIGPANKREVAMLLSVMLACAMTACLVLNLFLLPSRLWSMYAVGACVMLWVWVVPGLLIRKTPLWLVLLADSASVGAYVFLIAIAVDGMAWFLGLALPLLLLAAATAFWLGLFLGGQKRSILTTLTVIIGSAGVLLFGVELFIDRYLHQLWQPGWSVIVLVVSFALVIPLVVVRRVPRLREEARRRFHV